MSAVQPSPSQRAVDESKPSLHPRGMDGRVQSIPVTRPRQPPTELRGRALTLLHRVRPGHKQELVSYLTSLGTDIKGATDIAFARLRTVHFMRWVVLDDPRDPEVSTLVFESNYDGTSEEHLSELLREGAVGLHSIYRHCVGYPLAGSELSLDNEPAARHYLEAHAVTNAAFHVGNHGKSAQRIALEGEVRDSLQEYLNRRQRDASWREATLSEKYGELCAFLKTEGLFARLLESEDAPPKVDNAAWLSRLGLLALPLLPGLLPALAVLVFKELRDKPASYGAPPEWVRQLSEREDYQVQNQLTHVVELKPGPFRYWLLRGVLYAIDLLAKYKFNQGALGGITTIHFARWALVEGGRRLLFFSNYDGSWESYLGDFVDKAHVGLTAVWSNTEGFPRTRLLAFRGATDEDRFKAWTRAHQVPTPLWYSAYPNLTVRNIQSNARIAAGLLHKPETEAALRAWFETL